MWDEVDRADTERLEACVREPWLAFGIEYRSDVVGAGD